MIIIHNRYLITNNILWERNRWKPTHLCKLWKLGSQPPDLHRMASEIGANNFAKHHPPPPSYRSTFAVTPPPSIPYTTGIWGCAES
jgi:hypothetical protein